MQHLKTEYKKENFVWREEKDFDFIAKICTCESVGIIRAVSIWYEDKVCLYLLTVNFNGIKSFHGHNFCKNAQWFLMPFARRYIKEEELEWSAHVTKESMAVLKRLGFKYFATVMRRT